VHCADVRTHTRVGTGRTSRAGEGVESLDGLGDKRTEVAQACSRTEWYCDRLYDSRVEVRLSLILRIVT
jgi:hypothetical protein